MFLVNESDVDGHEDAHEDGTAAHDTHAWPRAHVPDGVKVLPRRTVERLLSASRLLDEARKVARRRVDQANDEADAIRQRAFDAGFAAGHGEGLKQFADATDAALAHLCHDAVQQSAIVEIIGRGMESLIGERGDDARIRGFVESGLATLHAPLGRVHLHVHPDQVDALGAVTTHWARRYALVEIVVSADSSVARDAYRIEGGGEDAPWCVSDDLPGAIADFKSRLHACG